MSVCVNIRTKNILEPEVFLKHLAEQGEKIVVTSNEYPSVKFGTHLKAIRGIEVNQEENGLEVRVCAYASTEDYQLFAKTITALMELTGDKAYIEDDDEDELVDALKTFDDEWIERERESSFMVTKALTRHSGSPVVLYGMFCKMCVGPKLYSGFDIDLDADYNKNDFDELQNYLCSVQWHFANLDDTSTRMMIPDPEEEGKGLTISALMIKGSEIKPFDYISEASLFAIFDLDNEEAAPALIPFDQLWKILPDGVFRSIDDWQYERTEELTVDMAREMMAMASRFQAENLHYKPIYPGEGYDDNQKTFILMWNPAISSVTMDDHNDSVENMLTEYFNWSVWDYKQAKIGDRFFLVRVGEGNTGIVMSGVFESNPYEAGDWNGKGRQTFYMDMKPNVILNPETTPMVTTEDLKKAIPSFDWSGGHSGRLLNEDESKAIEALWADYVSNHTGNIDGVNMNAININGR